MNKIKQTVVMVAAFIFVVLGVSTLQTMTASADCGGVQTSIVNCPQGGDSKDPSQSGVWGILLIVINIMVAAVGVAALAGIIYGAILYTSAGGNMEQTKKGMKIIGNVVIGIIAFTVMYGLLNFLIPGGVFN